MASSRTVDLSSLRMSVGHALALASLWLAAPVLAAPVSGGKALLSPVAGEQPDITRDTTVLPVVFAKKSSKGGGGSGNPDGGQDEDDKQDKKDDDRDDKDKKDKNDKKNREHDEDDKDGNKDKQDKKDKKDDKPDDKDKKDKNDKKNREHDEDDKDVKKDKKDKRDKKDKKDKQDDKPDDKNDKEDKDDKNDKKKRKDDNDKHGKKDKKDKDAKDRSGSGDGDEPETHGGHHDHDWNERHDHDDGQADDRHDHETEEDRHDHRRDEESEASDAGQGAGQDRQTGESVSDAQAKSDTAGDGEEPPVSVSDEEAPVAATEPAQSTVSGVVTLSWAPPTENEDGSPLLDLAGYRIYWRDTTGSHTGSMTIDNPGVSTIVIDNLVAGAWEFTMTSFNVNGIESIPSNAVTRTVAGPDGSGDVPDNDLTAQDPTSPTPAEAPGATTSTGDNAPHLMLSGTPPEAVIAGRLYLFTPGVETGTDEPPVFMIEGLPHWAGFNAVNGELYGAPADEDIGFYDAITISATDGVVETSLPKFSIEVVAPGAAPGAVTLSWMPPTENEDGTYLADLAGYWIYWGNNPGQYTEWMRIDNPGLTMVVIESLVPGDWEFAMTSFNAAGVESSLSNAVTRLVQ